MGCGDSKLIERARACRAVIASELLEELWKCLIHTSPISSTDRMIQLSFLHQIYYTPVCLFCMHKRDSAICHKCQLSKGTFLHMVWECFKVRPLWFMVMEFIADNWSPQYVYPPCYVYGELLKMRRWMWLQNCFLDFFSFMSANS